MSWRLLQWYTCLDAFLQVCAVLQKAHEEMQKELLEDQDERLEAALRAEPYQWRRDPVFETDPEFNEAREQLKEDWAHFLEQYLAFRA